ncbi:MAG: hypothetical protein ACRDWD_01150 [Acidimicrobiia bacterium]
MNTLTLHAAALAGALVLAACGDDGGGTTSPTDPDDAIEYPTGADDVVIRVEVVGGYEVGPAATDVPVVSVLGAGQVIVPGPTIERYPPPALPNLVSTEIDAEQIEGLLAEADELGLLEETDYGEPGITDQPETVVTIAANGEVYEHRAYALDFDVRTSDDVTEEQKAARENLAEFVEVATGSELTGDDALGSYEYDELAVISEDYSQPDGNEAPRPNLLDWPLGDDLATAGEPFDLGGRCQVVSGQDAVGTVVGQAEDATTITKWRSGGKSYSVTFVPLLPDEHSCDDLLPR